MVICLLSSVVVILLKSWYPLTLLLAASFIYVLPQKRFTVLIVAYTAVLAMSFSALICFQIMAVFIPMLRGVGLRVYVIPFLRVLILVNVILALALSSRTQEVLSSLKSLRLPLFLYLPAVVMIRFIPSFIYDIKQIHESLKIRGFRINPLSTTLHPALTLRLLFVPIVIRALRSSDELAVAAELKGVGYSDRLSYYKTHRLLRADYYAIAVACALAIGALLFDYQEALFF